MRLLSGWVLACFACICCLGELSMIGAQEQPHWIWDKMEAREKADQDPLLFRRAFQIDGDVETAGLWITADNRYQVVVNGVLVGQGENWQVPQKFVLKGLLREGDNEVVIRAKNDDDGPGALAAWLTYTTPQGEATLATDQSWQQRKDDSEANDLWWAARDDGGWKPAVELGAIKSTEPWGNQVAWDQPQEIVLERSLRPHQQKFEFLDGDRVTWIGGTWVERQQAFNYLETLVTAAYPDRNIRFRNLGWSGDDVTGISRAVFGSQEDGFKRLRDDLLRTSPNVILVSYGANEAFGGEEGLEAFEAGWNRLTRLLESTGAEIVVIGPHYLENLGPPLPDPANVNREVDRYAAALKQWSADRGYHFVDFRDPLGNEPEKSKFMPIIRDRLTDNGIHFNDYGYWRTAPKLAEKLNVPWSPWSVEMSLGDASRIVTGGRLQAFEMKPGRIQFTIQDDHLPYASPPVTSPRGGELSALSGQFVIKNLPEGKYGLNINGQPTVMATHDQWANGITLDRSKAIYQFEDLKHVVGKKNELYFHRYRPQNETYLFLFRKHEQGNNAVEVPQFEGLVADQEAVIEQLREPKPVTYELILIQQGDE